MTPRLNKEKSERKRLYFDLICGLVSSILAIIGIIFCAVMYGIKDMAGWLTGLVFWVLYFFLSVFLLSIGLYTKHKEMQMWGKKS